MPTVGTPTASRRCPQLSPEKPPTVTPSSSPKPSDLPSLPPLTAADCHPPVLPDADAAGLISATSLLDTQPPPPPPPPPCFLLSASSRRSSHMEPSAMSLLPMPPFDAARSYRSHCPVPLHQARDPSLLPSIRHQPPWPPALPSSPSLRSRQPASISAHPKLPLLLHPKSSKTAHRLPIPPLLTTLLLPFSPSRHWQPSPSSPVISLDHERRPQAATISIKAGHPRHFEHHHRCSLPSTMAVLFPKILPKTCSGQSPFLCSLTTQGLSHLPFSLLPSITRRLPSMAAGCRCPPA